ncbi:MAG: ATP-grasp domain-containing protein, partial [Planctomycetes bacterium]|nr:ATP-grasp domain-containing protein [Planctomycetota bacterium]
PLAPLIYTGALENYPRLIDALSQKRILWGNGSEVLRAVRDPVRLAETLRRGGLLAPDVTYSATEIPRDGTWLCKPLRSGGGWRISVWDGAASSQFSRLAGASGGRIRGGCYFQRRIEGFSCAALFVAAGGDARLLGVTRQLTGTSWTGAGPFSYAGSIGPLALTPSQQSTFCRIGVCLAAEFQLVGLFGVDTVVNDVGVWPLEVNPRYPASAEVLERACGFSAIGLHVDACARSRLPSSVTTVARCFAGKAIHFSAAAHRVPGQLLLWADHQNRGSLWPSVADVPELNGLLARGAPVLTVLAEGSDPQQVENSLRQQISAAEQLLHCTKSGT